jgi:type III secretion protein R
MAQRVRERRFAMTPDQHPLALLVLLGTLSLLPLAAITMTSYLKISVVLVLVRNAIGVQQAPPALALNAVALAATLFVMAPTLSACLDEAQRSASSATAGAVSGREQIARAQAIAEPLRQFMLRNSRLEERERFVELALHGSPDRTRAAAANDWSIVVPAFVVSELQAAFEIGLILFVPFVVIDLLVSHVLLALGMQMVPPTMVSLPLKLLLFVVANGWGRLIEALVVSYRS